MIDVRSPAAMLAKLIAPAVRPFLAHNLTGLANSQVGWLPRFFSHSFISPPIPINGARAYGNCGKGVRERTRRRMGLGAGHGLGLGLENADNAWDNREAKMSVVV
ncbi:hypothetical protein KM043_003363 [Ampulex compressa]|nr:hypothetical protein KM043_003363 [Ampulex compressa]